MARKAAKTQESQGFFINGSATIKTNKGERDISINQFVPLTDKDGNETAFGKALLNIFSEQRQEEIKVTGYKFRGVQPYNIDGLNSSESWDI